MKNGWIGLWMLLFCATQLQAQEATLQQRIDQILELERADDTRMIRVLQASQDQPHFTAYRVGEELISFTVGYVGASHERENHYFLANGELIAVEYSAFTYDPVTQLNQQAESRYRFIFPPYDEEDAQPIEVMEAGNPPLDSLKLADHYQEVLRSFQLYRDRILTSVYWHESDERILSILTFAQIVEQGIKGGYFGWAEIPDAQDPTIGSFGIPNQAEKLIVETGTGADRISHHYYIKEGKLVLYMLIPATDQPNQLLTYQSGQEYFYFEEGQLIRYIGPEGKEVVLTPADSEQQSRSILEECASYQQQLEDR